MTTLSQLIARATSQSEYSNLQSSDLFGIYPAKAYLTLDGTTDDYSELYTLINTTINGADAEIHFKDGSAYIGTSISIPSNVKLKFLNGGMLKPNNGVTITGVSAKIEAELHQIFDLSLGGTVAGTWDIEDFKAEWFGIVGDDNTVDNSPILEDVLNMFKNLGIELGFARKDYYFSTAITANGRWNGVRLKGVSSQNANGTRFYYTGTGYMFTIYGGDYIEMKDIYAQGDNTNSFITMADNTPSATTCRIGTSEFKRLNLSNFLITINIDAPTGYVYFKRCRFNYMYDKAIAIGENYANVASVLPGYIYFTECNIEGANSGASVNGIEIYAGQWMFINRCDICNFQSYGIYMNSSKGDIDHISITDNSLYNNATAVYVYRDNYMSNIKMKGNMCRIREAGNGYTIVSKTGTNYVHGVVVEGEMFSLAGTTITKIINFEYVHNLNFINNVPPYSPIPTHYYCTFSNIAGIFNKSALYQKQSTQNTVGATSSLDVTLSGGWSWLDVPVYPLILNLRPEDGNITWTQAYSTSSGVLTVSVNNTNASSIPFTAFLMA